MLMTRQNDDDDYLNIFKLANWTNSMILSCYRLILVTEKNPKESATQICKCRINNVP